MIFVKRLQFYHNFYKKKTRTNSDRTRELPTNKATKWHREKKNNARIEERDVRERKKSPIIWEDDVFNTRLIFFAASHIKFSVEGHIFHKEA